MPNVDNLEIKIISTAENAMKSLDELVKKLGVVAQGISAISNNKGLEEFAKKAESLSKSMNSVQSAVKNAASGYESLGQAARGTIRAVETETNKSTNNIRSRIEELQKRFQNSGKDYMFLGNLPELEKEIEKTSRTLQSLYEKQDRAIDLGKVDTSSFEALIRDIEYSQNKLEILKSELASMQAPQPINLNITGMTEAQEGISSVSQEAQQAGEAVRLFLGGFQEYDTNAIQQFVENFVNSLSESGKSARVSAQEWEEALQHLQIPEIREDNLQKLQSMLQRTEAEVDKLSVKLENGMRLGKIEIDSTQYRNLSENIKMAEMTADALRERIAVVSQEVEQRAAEARAAFSENLGNLQIPEIRTTSLDELKKQLEKTRADLDKLRTNLANDITMGRVQESFDDAGYRRYAESIVLASRRMRELEEATARAERRAKFDSAVASVKRFAVSLATLPFKAPLKIADGISKIGKVVSSVRSKIQGLMKAFSILTGAQKKNNLSFSSGIKTILKYGFGIRSAYILINKMRKAVIEGFQVLGQYSAETGANLDMLKSSLNVLRNSFAAAFSPIFNAIAPAINYLIELCTKAANAINQLLSALTGKGTWMKAVKATSDYSKGVSKAAKETDKLMKGIRGFDELNVINLPDDSSGGGGGSGADLEGAFEEVPIESKFQDWSEKLKEMWENADFTELGTFLGENLRDALNKIDWGPIQATAAKIGKSLATLINGFVEVEGLAESIGRTIGEAINTGVVGINAFLDNTHWDSVGKFIGDGLNSLVETINWENIGHMFAAKWNAIFEVIGNAARTFKWAEFGKKLADGFNKFVEDFQWEQNGANLGDLIKGLVDGIASFIINTDWGAFGSGLAKFINGLWTKINETIAGVDWGALGKSVIDLLAGFFGDFDWGNVSATISNIFKALYDFLSGLIDGVNWSELPHNIINAISEFFEGYDWDGMATSFGNFLGTALKAAIKLLGSLWDLLKEAWGNVSDYFSGYIDEAGGNIIEGLWNGIKDAVAKAAGWVNEHIVQPFLNAFKEAFGIHSPSTVMQEQGNFLMEGLFNGISELVDKVVEIFTGIKDKILGKWEEIKTNAREKWEEIKGEISGKWESIKTDVSTAVGEVLANVSEKWESIKTATSEKWGDIKEKISEKWNNIKEKTAEITENVKTKVSGAWENLKTKTGTAWSNIKEKISTTWGNIKQNTSDKVGNIKSAVSTAWSNIKQNTSTTWNNVKDTVSNVFKSMWNTIKGIINSILGGIEKMANGVVGGINMVIRALNGLNFTVPDWVPALGGSSFGFNIGELSTVSIPKLAKGGIVTDYTQLIAGEAGAEAILPLTDRGSMRMIADSILDGIDSGSGYGYSPADFEQAAYRGFKRAMDDYQRSGKNSPEIRVFIGDREITDIVIDGIDERTRRTGRTPFAMA